MYASGKRVYDMLSGRENTFLCEELKEAVETAKKETEKGRACVLSPAAASYDHFKNFEERGDVFKRYVMGEKL
jgi:UDP-N-acetylmuramoylalanine--D-glutamate ligase